MLPRVRRHYDFVVTGASGNVGRHLVPRLADRRYRILVTGRDVATLREQYSNVANVDIASYNDLDQVPSCDTLIHLAVRNNSQPGSMSDFLRDNVDFAEEVCGKFNRMQGKRFINISSVLSLSDGPPSNYAASKDIAARRMFALVEDRLDNVYIGYFHDQGYYGERLKGLTRLGKVGAIAFDFFKTIKPATDASNLVDYILGPPVPSSVPIILTDDLGKSPVYRTVTRAIDIVAAICVLTLFMPFFALLWAAIRLDSEGPALFAQQRVGRARSFFTLYKFRTMKRDTTAAATHEVGASAVTRVGRFLRRTKLDELPQAINLLRGEMTLVGPRPCLPVQEELLKAREALGIFAMKPGVTGYSQVRQIDMSRPQELAESDYKYMKLQSLALNIRILVLTILGRGAGDRVAPSGIRNG